MLRTKAPYGVEAGAEGGGGGADEGASAQTTFLTHSRQESWGSEAYHDSSEEASAPRPHMLPYLIRLLPSNTCSLESLHTVSQQLTSGKIYMSVSYFHPI